MIFGQKSTQQPIQVLLDENVPLATQDWLQNQRPAWQIWHVIQVGLGGKRDVDVLSWAQKHQSVIITFDGDFINNPNITRQQHFGIIRLRIHPTTIEETQRALERLLSEFTDTDLQGALITIGRDKIRVRPAQTNS
jgi:predicted nuclease of predicted toxin-antitoxin system